MMVMMIGTVSTLMKIENFFSSLRRNSEKINLAKMYKMPLFLDNMGHLKNELGTTKTQVMMF